MDTFWYWLIVLVAGPVGPVISASRIGGADLGVDCFGSVTSAQVI
jgi:hypothetical protein